MWVDARPWQQLRATAGLGVDRFRELRVGGAAEVRSGPAAGLLLDRRAPQAMVSGLYERSVQMCLTELVRPGDTVFDIGANEGFLTLLLQRLVGADGHVVAFEPSPRNVRRLRRNLRLNGVESVTVQAVAVSDRSGRDRLWLTRYGGGPSLVSSDVRPPDAIRATSVTVRRLDDLVGDVVMPPALVKIDVEGAEEQVLRGMDRVLRHHRPVVLVEVDGPSGPAHLGRWAHVDAMLGAHDYATEHLEPAYPSLGNWAVGHTLGRPRTRS
jgi:FkbM family methyltransferase